MLGRELEVVRKTQRERAYNEAAVHEKDQAGKREARNEAGAADGGAHRRSRHRRRATGDRDERPSAVEPNLRDVEPERQNEEDRAHGGGARVLAESRDKAVGLGREDIEDSADELRVAEVFEYVDGGREDRRAESGTGQRKRHRPEDAPGARAEVVRRLLHARVAP